MTQAKQTEKRLKRTYILKLREFLLFYFLPGSVSLAESKAKDLTYTIRKNFENAANGY